MKQFLITLVVCFVLQFFLPWWSLMIGAAVISFFVGRKGGAAFLSAAFACGIGWVVYAFYINGTKGHILTDRMGQLFQLPSSNIFFIVVFVIAAIAGGVAAWTGWSLKQLTRR